MGWYLPAGQYSVRPGGLRPGFRVEGLVTWTMPLADGGVDFLKTECPEVNVTAFGKREFRRHAYVIRSAGHQWHDIVSFLNNDMRVEDEFLPALLDEFTDRSLTLLQMLLRRPRNKGAEERRELTEGLVAEGARYTSMQKAFR